MIYAGFMKRLFCDALLAMVDFLKIYFVSLSSLTQPWRLKFATPSHVGYNVTNNDYIQCNIRVTVSNFCNELLSLCNQFAVEGVANCLGQWTFTWQLQSDSSWNLYDSGQSFLNVSQVPAYWLAHLSPQTQECMCVMLKDVLFNQCAIIICIMMWVQTF